MYYYEFDFSDPLSFGLYNRIGGFSFNSYLYVSAHWDAEKILLMTQMFVIFLEKSDKINEGLTVRTSIGNNDPKLINNL